jgi:thiamine kinase-like enzyme
VRAPGGLLTPGLITGMSTRVFRTSAKTMTTLDEAARRRAEALPCWKGAVTAEPVAGGMSNRNFRVSHQGERFFVRIGDDAPEHHVSRADEIAASLAAAAAGLGPALVHAEPGATVFRWIDGRTLTPADVRDPVMLPRIVELLHRVHREVGRHLRGRLLAFWVFHAMRDYVARLGAERFLPAIDTLETAVQPIELVFGHNDLLAANLVDDGARLWLIDWEYAGYNTPLFDLANLASNNELSAAMAERLLALYFGSPADDDLRRRFAAMTAASLLRETLWSMVAERQSTIECDFAAYSALNLARFEAAFVNFQQKTW